MAPIIQLTMLGYAATTDVRNVPLVVVDQDGSSESRDLVSRFEASQSFMVIDRVSSVSEIDAYLDTGRAWMALTIPADYGRRVRAGTPTTVQVVADGTDANSTNVALGYAGALIADYARELAAASGLAPEPPLVSADVRVWFNPQLESRDFMIPGHPRVAAAGRDHEPVVDGDRARARARHARAAQRDADRALGADPRQDAAVRADRRHRRSARGRRRGVLVRGAAARQLRAAAGDVPASIC